jgi:glycogen(starch) synthase
MAGWREDERMRVLIVSNLYPPQELGGYGRSLADFAWGLQQRGHHVEVVCSDAPYLGPSSQGPNGEPVQRTLRLKGNFAKGVELLQDPQACQQIDQHNSLVLTSSLASRCVDGILLGNLDLLGPELLQPLLEPGIPVLHHVGFMAAPFGIKHWPRQENYQLVAASQAVRASLTAAGLPVQHAPVVYPGARVELFGAAELDLWREAPAGIPANPLKLCFAGLLMGSKGAHTAVEAVGLLHQAGINVQLNLAGAEFQKGYWKQLQAFGQHLGLGDHQLNWLGALQRPKLSRFFQLHHAGIFPSTYPEAFGIVGAEMQASGLALVSSGVGGACELLEHGITGLLFQPDNAADLAQQLKRLISEAGLLGKLQRKGQVQVRQCFSVNRAAAALERLFLNN